MNVVPTAAPVTNCPAARACHSERTGTAASPSAAVIRSEPVIHGSGKFSKKRDISANQSDGEGGEQDDGRDRDIAQTPAGCRRWLWRRLAGFCGKLVEGGLGHCWSGRGGHLSLTLAVGASTSRDPHFAS